MSRWLIVFTCLCAGAVVACGGGEAETGSGVEASKSLLDLDDDEVSALCEYIVEVSGELRVIDCDGVIITLGGRTVERCVTDVQTSQDEAIGCTATVEDIETCARGYAEFTDEEWCSDEEPLPAACVALVQCGDVL